MQPQLSIRELDYGDIPQLADYWFTSDESYLRGMGVDIKRVPPRDDFSSMIAGQLQTPLEERRSFALIWEVGGKAIGHTNTNPTTFGEEAFMHVHIWKPEWRRAGLGSELLRQSLPVYFNKLELKRLICEPYALNPAPNNTLEKLGFELEKEYVTTPGAITFEQPVKR